MLARLTMPAAVLEGDKSFDGVDHVMREWGPYPSGLQRNPDPDAAVDHIALALFEATTLLPNSHVSSLDELRARFPFSE